MRIKLNFPEQNSIFTTNIPILISDINYGNHLGNDKLLSIIHESRVRLLQSIDKSEMDIGGCGIIMSDVIINYKAEGFYGDLLNIDIFANDITRASFDLMYSITTLRNNETVLVAEAKTGIVCFDYKTRRATAIPEDLLSFLQQ